MVTNSTAASSRSGVTSETTVPLAIIHINGAYPRPAQTQAGHVAEASEYFASAWSSRHCANQKQSKAQRVPRRMAKFTTWTAANSHEAAGLRIPRPSAMAHE